VIFWHPDRNKDPKAKEVFHKIHEAYLVLSGETSKKTYDSVLNAKIIQQQKVNEKDNNSKRMKEDLLRREAAHAAKKQKINSEEILRKYSEQDANRKRESWRKYREEITSQYNTETNDSIEEEEIGATIKVTWNPYIGSYSESNLRNLFAKYGIIKYILAKHKNAYITFKYSYAACMALEREAGDVENPITIYWERTNKLKPDAAKTLTNSFKVPHPTQHKNLETLVFANLRRAAEDKKLKENVILIHTESVSVHMES